MTTYLERMRQSNFELLRIVAMLMILMVHFDGASLGLPVPASHWESADWIKTLVEALSIIGVNLFVMISGYFGIRLTAKRLTAYIGMCLFYSLGIYVLWLVLSPQALFTAKGAIDALLVFSHGDLWFVRDYLLLMLLSPLLNAGLSALDRRSQNTLIISLVVINCYFGWWNGGAVNPTGYCLMQLISVYILGYWLRGVKLSSLPAAAIWLSGYVLTIIMAMYMPSSKAYAYNSPSVIAASVGMFMLFADIRISSSAINHIARHTFAVYLIHKDPYVWRMLKFDVIVPLYNNTDGFRFMISISLFTVFVYAACIAIDYVRSVNVTNLLKILKNK